MPPFLKSQNRKLRIRLTPLVENADEATALSADIAAASSTLTVQSINRFAVNKILLIGELGAEDSEIVKTHASSAPSGSTITLSANTTYAHKAGTKVRMISFDQIELSHATTATGSKTVLTTTLGTGLVALEADEMEMVYDETEFTSGYYFGRYKNSIASTFGSYSDAVPYGGFTEDSVAAVIDYALKRSQVKDFNDEISREWCYEEITDMLRHVQGKQKRWNKYQSLNTSLGTTARGTRRVAMPDDIYDPDSNRSITGIRIGEGRALAFKDPDEFEEYLYGEKTTTVATQQTAGGTTLVLTDTDDFDDDGTITVFISGTKYDITYTSITRSTHTLNGIPASGDGAITVTIPAATNVWQNYKEGEPIYYTVRNQGIEFAPMPSDLWDNKNIFADYWTEATAADSDADTLDTERFDMAKYWLTWKMRCQAQNAGKLDYKDGDYQMFADRLKDAIVFKGNLMKHKMMPRVNGIRVSGGFGRTRRRNIGE
jgi:hypothetical protein